jgi:hypothetical protein
MTTPDPVRGGDAEPGPIASVVRLFLGQLAAVVVIAAAITVIVTLVDSDDDRTVRTGAPAASDAPGAPESSAPAPSTPAASPAPSSPAASGPAASSAAPSGTPAPPSSTPPRKDPRVDVLNQSAPGGSAAQTARRLRDQGWRIGRVEDFSGNVSTTTVYWLDRSDRKAARRLARDLGGVRVQPGFSTLVEGRLSVILVE